MARSPIEKAIAEKTDRRRAYDAKMTREGFVRCNLWIKAEAAPHVRFLVKCLNATNGKFLADLQALTETWEAGE